MHSRTSLFTLSLMVAAPLASFAQEGTKIPRPLPVFVDKPAPAETANSALPAPIARPIAGRSSKPLPTGAPRAVTTVPTRPGLLFDEPGDGRTWAVGRDYKASFGAEGATFVPFLGSEAPRNFPVRFALASMTVDGAAVELRGDGRVARDGRRISIERGVADEVYDLEEGRMEQTIAIESLPTRGALSIVIDVETELASRAIDGGVRFENELGGVDYGRVTVLDRNGLRFETSAELQDGDLRIDVPAAFVADAVFPLRVDPYVTSVQVAASTVDEYYSDVSYDESSGRWVVLYQGAFSSSDHDVYAVAFDAFGVAVPFGIASIDVTSDYWGLPKIANNNLANQFLAVAGVYPAAGGVSVARGRTLGAFGMNTGAQFTISGIDVGSKYWVDVGGDPALVGPTYYCVVWQRDFAPGDTDIHARLVDTGSNLVGTSTTYLDNSGGTLDGRPRISKSSGGPPFATQDWNVAWQRYSTVSTSNDVYAAQVHWDGVVTTSSTPITTGPNNDEVPVPSSPLAAASGPRPWMIAYQRDFGPDHDILATFMSGGTVSSVANLSSIDVLNTFEDQLEPNVDSDGIQYSVVFSESYLGSTQDYDTYVSSFAVLEGSVEVTEAHINYDFSSNPSFAPRIASKYSSGGPSHSMGVTWSRFDTFGALSDIYLGLYDAPSEGPANLYCFSGGGTITCPCGNLGGFNGGCANSFDANGAWLNGVGSHRISTDSFFLSVSGLPSSATCLFFQGTTEVNNTFGDGVRCVGGTIIRLGIKTASAGVASYPNGGDAPVSLKGLIPAGGARRNYQVWYRDSASYCTASSFNLSSAFAATWLP